MPSSHRGAVNSVVAGKSFGNPERRADFPTHKFGVRPVLSNPLFGGLFRATLVGLDNHLGDLLRIGSRSSYFTASLVLHQDSQGPQMFFSSGLQPHPKIRA